MFEVEIEGQFTADHQLRLPDGSLEPLHGHDWPVRVTVAGERTDGMGCLVDFHELQARLADVISPLHGTRLNDHEQLGPANPSAEHVARFIATELAERLGEGVRLVSVRVGEAPGCYATYRLS